MARKSLSGDRKKRNKQPSNQTSNQSSFNRDRDLPNCLKDTGSSFSAIRRLLFYKKPILEGIDADYLMRQGSPRLVDRITWQFFW